MQIERIHFDEVFDVAATQCNFSFRSGGRTHYGVHLQRGLRHGPIPHAGTAWIVAFAEPDDWSTVLGWLDLQTGTVTLREPAWVAMLLGIGSLVLYGPFLLAGALILGGPGPALAVLLMICCYAGLRLWQVLSRNRQVREALLGEPRVLLT